MKNYTLEQAVERLLRNRVKVNDKVIYKRPNQLGIKLLGVVDYLVNYHNFIFKSA